MLFRPTIIQLHLQTILSASPAITVPLFPIRKSTSQRTAQTGQRTASPSSVTGAESRPPLAASVQNSLRPLLKRYQLSNPDHTIYSFDWSDSANTSDEEFSPDNPFYYYDMPAATLKSQR